MPFLTRLPDALDRFGLQVETVKGWEKRGYESFNPGCSMGHHTAGPATGIRPTLNVCTYGHSTLPGPLCNTFLDRNGVAVVVAAGRANHAGKGGFRGLVGNSAALGCEAESKGTEPGAWTAAQLAALPKVHAAHLWLIGRDETWYCNHKTWAPTRKIDMVSLSDEWMRVRVAALLRPSESVAPIEEETVFRALHNVDTNAMAIVGPRFFRHIPTMAEWNAILAGGLVQATPDAVSDAEWRLIRVAATSSDL